MKLEGGFQGRTNKLVDACYSFWQGSALAIVEIIRNGNHDLFDLETHLNIKNQEKIIDQDKDENENENEDGIIELAVGTEASVVEDDNGALLYNQKALQRYILHCSQNIDGGGLRDKPGKHRDYYHTLVSHIILCFLKILS